MEQYQPTKRTFKAVRETVDSRDPLLESAVNRVNHLTSIVEAQQRQLRRLEAQISDLQRIILANKK